MLCRIIQFWLSAYEIKSFTSRLWITSHAHMWKQWDCNSQFCNSQRPRLVIHIYMGNYLGHVVINIGIVLFFQKQLKNSIYLYINWLWKINPLREQFTAVKCETPLYLYTLWCTYASIIPGYSCLLVIYTCTKPQEETAGKWPLLFTSVSAPKLTSGSTLRGTDMETNKCFYLRATIMSGASNSGTGWLWQSNGPASLFPCVPDGNLSTLTYKLHFPKSRFHLDHSAETGSGQKEIRERFKSSANGFSFYSSSKWALLCCQKTVMWFIGQPWGTVMEQSNSDTDNRIC